MTQLIESVAEQTYTAMSNISQSLGFAVRNGAGKLEFTPLADYFQRTVDGAILGIEGGFFDYNTVIKRVISEMTNSGLRTVDYATGWSNRVDVAARRAVMTGYNQLVAKTNEHNAEQLGTEYFEVTWHSGARPSHQEWQGRVFSKAELVSKCGLGTVEGLCGANCYHNYYPFVPGVSQRTYTDEQLEQMNAEENQKREYLGREYTKYEALQRQRQLETRMRAQRQQIKLLQDGGANEDDIINARCRYRGTSQEYTHFSRAMDLPQQRQRVTADGLGNIGAGKFTGGSGKESPMGVPKVGATRRDKVSAAEREELLKRGNSNKKFINITEDWIPKKIKPGTVTELQEYTVNGEKYTVDGRHVVLKPSKQEKEVAAALSEYYGKNVGFVPQIMFPQGIQTPDYLIGAERFDLKSPTGSGKTSLYDLVAKKKKQSPNFIFNITNCPLSEEEIERQIAEIYSSSRTKFVEKIVVMKNGKVLNVYAKK